MGRPNYGILSTDLFLPLFPHSLKPSWFPRLYIFSEASSDAFRRMHISHCVLPLKCTQLQVKSHSWELISSPPLPPFHQSLSSSDHSSLSSDFFFIMSAFYGCFLQGRGFVRALDHQHQKQKSTYNLSWIEPFLQVKQYVLYIQQHI